jgi:hypothetical protein
MSRVFENFPTNLSKIMVIALAISFLGIGEISQAKAATVSWAVRDQGSVNAPTTLALVGLDPGSNPFDPVVASVTAKVTTPDGKELQTALFWFQDYALVTHFSQVNSQPVGAGEWRLRLRTMKVGSYSISVSASINGAKVEIPTYTFESKVASAPQFAANTVGFTRGDTPFVPIAYNIAWSNRYEEISKYTQWFKAASAAGVNVARVWMASWDMGIEWADTGLGDYSKRLDRAWALDQVFAIGQKYGVNIDLVLLNHGAFSESTNPEFFSSPYNSSNGGPISDPAKFVTDPTSIKFWHQRLRYIAARWGAEPNLFSWEWWNEVNFTPIDQSELTTWIKDSHAFVDQFAPYKSLTTTSWSNGASLRDWSSVDYVSIHVYDSGDPIKSLGIQYQAIKAVVPDKPALIAEFGSGSNGEDVFVDPYGLHLHNSHYAATFIGFGAPASYWWWDNYVDPLNLWKRELGLTKLIKGLDVAHMKPGEVFGINKTQSLTLTDADHLLGWVRLDAYCLSGQAALRLDAALFSLKTHKKLQTVFPAPTSKGGNLAVTLPSTGDFHLTFTDSESGKLIASTTLHATSVKVIIKVPAFTGDIAFRADRVGSKP